MCPKLALNLLHHRGKGLTSCLHLLSEGLEVWCYLPHTVYEMLHQLWAY